jgi:hypothetical protein
MVFVLGFESPVIPAGLNEGRRETTPDPDSSRVTPINEAESSRADPRKSAPNERPAIEKPTRIAFTAKFGPDSDGFPLQLVKGDDVTAAETIDIEVITARRISREDREILLRAQEAQGATDDSLRRLDERESADATTLALEQREQQDGDRQRLQANQTGSTFDLQI